MTGWTKELRPATMRYDPTFLSWLVPCSSPEEARRLQDWLAERVTLVTVMENVIRGYPEGEESDRVEYHRLGDYFEEIRVFPGSPDLPSVFRVVFHRRPDAGRFWKDLMVRNLVSLQKLLSDTKITLDYRGEEDPVAAERTAG
jgi:hypothetical protein